MQHHKRKNSIRVFPYATEHTNKTMSPFLFILRKGEVKAYSDSHKGEEFLMVLRGVMLLTLGKVEYTMHEGDSLYFDPTDGHSCTPLSEEVEFLSIHV